MASTITLDSQPDGRSVTGDRQVRRGSMTLGTYASGGIAVTAAQLELPYAVNDLRVDPSGGYVPRWNKSTGKVMVYVSKDPGAVGGADVVLQEVGVVDISATAFRFRAEGV